MKKIYSIITVYVYVFYFVYYFTMYVIICTVQNTNSQLLTLLIDHVRLIINRERTVNASIQKVGDTYFC